MSRVRIPSAPLDEETSQISKGDWGLRWAPELGTPKQALRAIGCDVVGTPLETARGLSELAAGGLANKSCVSRFWRHFAASGGKIIDSGTGCFKLGLAGQTAFGGSFQLFV